ncbi:hypothetical protein TRFO_31986 [Tritrichomonas foetus]|uniref:Guanylate cyclase domain-containing protein n=1 Tax=Tritrichomonas foetus TaxID=1144522 RepID=A0A1J4JR61_9EUKA|nr:hypothetical protein TRFO_31986 [Tritrichomonas foetus]|eukprot:OHT01242.1 hypothetical protein TRFO_31986 [Tritrichomonas foetus]
MILVKCSHGNHYMATISNIIMEGIVPIVLPIIMSISGRELGFYFIQKKDIANGKLYVYFFLIIIIQFLFILAIDNIPHLYFAPRSFACFTQKLQTVIILISSLINFIGGILPHCSKNWRIALYVILILLYSTTFLFVPMLGGFIKNWVHVAFFSITLFSIISLIIELVLDIIHREMAPFIILMQFFILIICNVICYIVRKKERFYYLGILNQIEEHFESFDYLIKNVFHGMNIAGYGFSDGHSLILSWKFLRMMTDRWPYFGMVWSLWARFVACFPEENQLLLWIDDEINKNVAFSTFIGAFRIHIHYLVKKREVSLTPDLKKGIEICSKSIVACRARMLKYWESYLIGNLLKTEAASLSANHYMKITQNKIKDLLKEYPNNQHSAMIYLKFASSVLYDELEISKWTEMIKKLKDGISVSPDIAHTYAMIQFPRLSAFSFSKGSNTNIVMDVFRNQQQPEIKRLIQSPRLHISKDDNDKSGNISPITMSLRNLLNNVKVPSIFQMCVFFACYFCINFIIVLPIVESLGPRKFKKYKILMGITNQMSVLRVQIVHLTFVMIEKIAQLTFIEPMKDKISGNPLDNETLIFNTDEFIHSEQNKLEDTLTYLRKYESFSTIDDNVKHAISILFNKDKEYIDYSVTVFPNYTASFKNNSVEGIAMNAKIMGSLIQVENYTSIYDFIKDERIWNTVSNAFLSVQFITEGCKSIDKFIQESCKEWKNTTTIFLISYPIITFIFYSFFIAFFILKLLSQRRATLKAMSMLPKHCIRANCDNFTHLARIGNDSTIERSTNDEDRTISAFASITSNKLIVFQFIIKFVIFEACVYLCLLSCSIAIYRTDYKLAVVAANHCPFHHYFLLPYTHSVLGTTCIYMLSLIDGGIDMLNVPRQSLTKQGIETIANIKNDYKSILFGNQELGMVPMNKMDANLVEHSFITKNLDTHDGTNLHVSYASDMSRSSTFYLACIFMHKTLLHSNLKKIGLFNESTANLWHMLIDHVYDGIFNTALDMGKSTDNDYNIVMRDYIWVLFICYLLGAIFMIASIISIRNVHYGSRWIIMTLIHCPTDVLLKCEPIMKILCNDFTEEKQNKKSFSDGMCKKITNLIEDIVVISDEMTNILHASKSFYDFFGEQHPELNSNDDSSKRYCCDMSFRDLLIKRNPDSSVDLFLREIDTALSGRSTFNISRTLCIDNKDHYLDVCVRAFYKNKEISSIIESNGKLSNLIFSCRDVSEKVRIETEFYKCVSRINSLLESALPPLIVKKYLSRDEEISFYSQCASILTLCINGFTSTIGQISAAQVMSIVNRIVVELDDLIRVNYASTISRVATSDYYAAASGVINSNKTICKPDEYAKKCVSLAVDFIKKMTEIHKEIGITLNLKIGVSLDGPVFAGLMKLDRPTFNVVGKAVELSTKLMKTCIPDAIHISRNVYEMVYEESYNIKEAPPLDENTSEATYHIFV